MNDSLIIRLAGVHSILFIGDRTVEKINDVHRVNITCLTQARLLKTYNKHRRTSWVSKTDLMHAQNFSAILESTEALVDETLSRHVYESLLHANDRREAKALPWQLLWCSIH